MNSPRLAPLWLRPVALVALIGMHGAALLGFHSDAPPATPLESVEVSLVALGDSAEEQTARQETQPDETPPPPAPPPPELTAPPPQVANVEAPTLLPDPPEPTPLATPTPTPTPAQLPPPKPAPRVVKKPNPKRVPHGAPQEAQQAEHKGVEAGVEGGAMSKADYGALVIAELARRKFFPAAAQDAGVVGSVGVAFTLGPTGRVVRQSITKSSGNADLDAAARAILSSLQPPPPPGGSFDVKTRITFTLD